jgi:hypothetical protein
VKQILLHFSSPESIFYRQQWLQNRENTQKNWKLFLTSPKIIYLITKVRDFFVETIIILITNFREPVVFMMPLKNLNFELYTGVVSLFFQKFGE